MPWFSTRGMALLVDGTTNIYMNMITYDFILLFHDVFLQPLANLRTDYSLLYMPWKMQTIHGFCDLLWVYFTHILQDYFTGTETSFATNTSDATTNKMDKSFMGIY